MDKNLQIKGPASFAKVLQSQYMERVKNYLGDEKNAKRFMSCVMSSVQANPALLQCESTSLINSFMTMASLGLMPSNISGEAYVIPYKGKAQFQLGYQGLVTLFYKAGGQEMRAEIVRENDKFSYKNGKVDHEIDIFKSNEERGKVVGAYAVAVVNGREMTKVMNIKDILHIAEKYSKSYKESFSAWHNDPEGWMIKKSVMKQLGKMLPKNETINKAIAEDNKDSIIQDRLDKAETESQKLTMGNFLKNENKNTEETINYSDESDEALIAEFESRETEDKAL